MTNLFTIKELKEKGAKRVVLEYITEQDPSIPIPRTVDLEDREGIIVRSDHWREFDSFYGIFESVPLHKTYESGRLDNIYESLVPDLNTAKRIMMLQKISGDDKVQWEMKERKKLFKYYCKVRGLNPQEVLDELKLFPQEYMRSEKKELFFSIRMSQIDFLFLCHQKATELQKH